LGAQTRGFRSQPLLDIFVSEVTLVQLEKDNITVIYNETPINYSAKDWLIDIRQGLERAKQNLETLDKTKETADRTNIYSQVHSILKDFLASFFKLYIANRNAPIKIRGRSPQMEDWDLIKASINTYIKDKKLSLKSYFICVLMPFIAQVQDNYKMISRGLYTPTERDISVALKYIDDVIVYFLTGPAT